MKSILVAVALMVGCGGSKPAPAAQPANTEPAPAGDGSATPMEGSGAGSAAAAGSCEAAGGQCMQMQAAISCSGRPEGTCPENHFCCKL